MSKKNTAEVFWSRVNTTGDGCWEWSGAVTSSGYGNLSWGGRSTQAHRVAYFLSHGAIELATGFRIAGRAKRYKQFVLHHCDNRRCCNPAHLFLGSLRANLLDAYGKGRRKQPGSMHINAKVCAADVRAIREAYAQGARQVDLAKQYGVSQRAISLLVRRETYKDVT